MTAAKKPGRKAAAKKRAPRKAAARKTAKATKQAAKADIPEAVAELAAKAIDEAVHDRVYVFDEPQETARGRPAKYERKFASQASKLCELGATDEELADFFEVSVRTIYRWMIKHDDFCQAVKVAKEVADNRVERSLYQRAVGYRTPSVKIFMPAGSKEPVYARFFENVQPSDTAIVFWLKNRRKDTWRDRQDHEHSGPDGGAIEIDETEAARRVAFMIGQAAGKIAEQKAQEESETASDVE